ncbi:MAG: transglutaminase-like domain-containing protein [Bdellovibrionia bacterium]
MRKFRWKFDFNRVLDRETFELWLPQPQETPFQKRRLVQFTTNAQFKVLKNAEWNFDYIYLKFKDKENGILELTYDLEIAERSSAGESYKWSQEKQELYLQTRPHVPINEFIISFAQNIIGSASSAEDKAAKIYHWIIHHGERDPNQVGCGLGNVEDSLREGHICGRCVDVSSVAVALLRAVGVPSRELFGMRLGPALWTSGLGRTGDNSEAFHCKVEFMTEDQRWLVMDPGDVLKLALDEKLESTSSRFQEISTKLLLRSDANWVYFNSLRDSSLEPATGMLENYFMYPLGLNLGERVSPYYPREFGFNINVESLE